MPPIANRWNLPDLGMGLGLRGVHLAEILQNRPRFGSDGQTGWFEVISDNALVHQGRFCRVLDDLAETYPLVLHGVGLNIGSADALDRDYLNRLKNAAARWRVPWVSDHLCWTGVDGRQTHDLLPLPYNRATLDWLVQRVRQVQEALERPLILENPSSYLQFRTSTMDEWAFLAELCERADCGLLLDVNNVYVAAQNHGYAWQTYLAAVPWDRVCQFHVAGHTTLATHLFDSHIGPVDPPVWDVLRAAFSACGGRSLLLEWDFEIPDFAETSAEAARAWSTVADLHQPLPKAPTATPEVLPDANTSADAAAPAALEALQRWMVDAITGTGAGDGAADWIATEGALTPEARIAIHTAMYAARVDDALREDFPVLRGYLGDEVFDARIARYRRDEPSTHWALEHVGQKLAPWLGNQTDVPAPAADVARLERARVEALLAPTCPPFDAQVLAGLSADDHEQLELHFAPGTQLLSLGHAVAGLWQAGRVRPGPQTVLVFPHGSEVIQRVPGFAEAALLRPLLAGTTLGDAMAEVAAADPEAADELALHVGAWFADWAATGLVVRVHVAKGASPSGCR